MIGGVIVKLQFALFRDVGQVTTHSLLLLYDVPMSVLLSAPTNSGSANAQITLRQCEASFHVFLYYILDCQIYLQITLPLPIFIQETAGTLG